MVKMPDESAAPKILPVAGAYPGFNFPTVYADSVSSIQPGKQTTKFYLSRYEPHLEAENTLLTQPVVQVVMPTGSFVETAAFFGRMVRQLIESGVIDQATWDQAVANYEKVVPKA
jgi:hypothetical protein